MPGNARVNVAFVLNNPKFQDTFTVTRTPVNANGEATLLPNGQPDPAYQQTLTVNGVVEIGTVDPVYLEQATTYTKKAIIVWTQTRLYDVMGNAQQMGEFQPDIVNYHGDPYKVVKPWDWSAWGSGYYCYDCQFEGLTSSVAGQ